MQVQRAPVACSDSSHVPRVRLRARLQPQQPVVHNVLLRSTCERQECLGDNARASTAIANDPVALQRRYKQMDTQRPMRDPARAHAHFARCYPPSPGCACCTCVSISSASSTELGTPSGYKRHESSVASGFGMPSMSCPCMRTVGEPYPRLTSSKASDSRSISTKTNPSPALRIASSSRARIVSVVGQPSKYNISTRTGSAFTRTSRCLLWVTWAHPCARQIEAAAVTTKIEHCLQAIVHDDRSDSASQEIG